MFIPRDVQLRLVNALWRKKLPEGLALEEVEALVAHFEEPWRGYADWLLDVLSAAPSEQQRFLDSFGARLPKEDREVLRGVPEEPDYPSLADLAAGLLPITWLWPGWIPRGMLSLLGAVPGAGKSFAALDLCRRVIEGSEWPDGSPMRDGKGTVIYIDAEAVPQIINQRAANWGMDLQRIYLMLPEDYEIIDLSESRHQQQLVQMTWYLRPQLIVADSLSSITLRGENNVEDVRVVLAFLARMARQFECGMLLIHHLRKRGKQLPLMDALTADDFRGSSHIIAMARSVLALSVVQTGPKPDRNGPRQLEVVKTNLCQYPEPLGMWFETMGDGVRLRYGNAPERYQEPTTVKQAEEWLVQVLEDLEELRPKRIIELGREEGFGESTIYRARKQLGGRVIDTKGYRHPENCWMLAVE